MRDFLASMQSVVNEPGDYVTETSVGEQPVSAMQYYAAAMAAMFLLFNAMVGGKSLHRERQTVTLSRLMMTPTSIGSILVGKFIGTFLFASFQFTVFIAVTHYLLKVDWGANVMQTIFHRVLLLHCRFWTVDGDGCFYDGRKNGGCRRQHGGPGAGIARRFDAAFIVVSGSHEEHRISDSEFMGVDRLHVHHVRNDLVRIMAACGHIAAHWRHFDSYRFVQVQVQVSCFIGGVNNEEDFHDLFI